MATNPNNAIGTNGAYGGRTSVNAFNDDLAIYSGRGIISGWACAPSSGLTVVLGGDGLTRDVAVAQDNAGNRTTINNISGAPVSVTLSGAPTANSRIDAIVAYVDNPPQGSATITDNYQTCGIIAVTGTPAASPSAPTESAIRSAITADGASGSTAYYVVLATITVSTGATDIVAENITAGASAQVRSDNSSPIPDGSITADKIDFSTFGGNYSTNEIDTGFTWTDGSKIYKKTFIMTGGIPAGAKSVPHNITNLKEVIDIDASFPDTSTPRVWRKAPVPNTTQGLTYCLVEASETHVFVYSGTDRPTWDVYATLYYTKTN